MSVFNIKFACIYAIKNYASMLLLFYVRDCTRLIIHSIHGFAAILLTSKQLKQLH